MAVNIQMTEKSINLGKKQKPMSEKKKKIKKISIIVIVILTISLLGGCFLTQRAGLKLSVTDIFNPIKANPQLEKDSSGKYTNVLFVGIDSRGEYSGLQNTDTIMIVSYNHEENYAVMTSIPRDFFVEVPEQARYTKINGVYAIGERIEEGSGLEYLSGVVEKVTGREIQYHAMVNLVGFVDLIDAIGGVEVDVENTFTDYRYPVEGNEIQHQTVSFQAGPQNMDGRTALRFVRSRLSMDAYEGSDFARARRQQRVIEALKNELFSSSTYLNPKRILDIIGILENNIKYSEFTNEEIQAAMKIFQKEDMKTYSFVLDPSLANYKLITDKGLTLTGYTIGPVSGLTQYEEIQKYLSHAHKKPKLYSEDLIFRVYDIGLGYQETFEEVNKLQEMHPYIEIVYMGTLLTDIEGNYFFNNSEEDVISEIDEYFPLTIGERPEFLEDRIFNGDYIILLGSND